MAQSKYHNHYIPTLDPGAAYWKGGRIRVPKSNPLPKFEDILKWRAHVFKLGLISFQGKE